MLSSASGCPRLLRVASDVDSHPPQKMGARCTSNGNLAQGGTSACTRSGPCRINFLFTFYNSMSFRIPRIGRSGRARAAARVAKGPSTTKTPSTSQRKRKTKQRPGALREGYTRPDITPSEIRLVDIQLDDSTSVPAFVPVASIVPDDPPDNWQDTNEESPEQPPHVPPPTVNGKKSRKKRRLLPDADEQRLYERWTAALPSLKAAFLHRASRHEPQPHSCAVPGCRPSQRNVTCVFWKRACTLGNTHRV